MNYNEQALEIHQLNEQWWYDEHGNKLDRNAACLLMLAVTEVSEGCEGLRKDLWDDHLPHHKMITVELSDARIRLLDFAGGFGINIADHDDYNPKFDVLGYDIESQAEGLMLIVDEISAIHVGWEDSENIRYALNAIAKFAQKYGYDIDTAQREKLIYNQTRADHKHENRKKENGKRI